MTYRTKTVLVDTFRYQLDFRPAWFTADAEADLHAETGDWILRSATGLISLCKPDIFETIYEANREPTEDDA